MTLDDLFEIRREGHRPDGLLNVGIGDIPFVDYELWLPRLPDDLRPFAGLDVWITAPRVPLREIELTFRECRTLIATGSDGYRCTKWLGEPYACT